MDGRRWGYYPFEATVFLIAELWMHPHCKLFIFFVVVLFCKLFIFLKSVQIGYISMPMLSRSQSNSGSTELSVLCDCGCGQAITTLQALCTLAAPKHLGVFSFMLMPRKSEVGESEYFRKDRGRITRNLGGYSTTWTLALMTHMWFYLSPN